MDSGSLIGVVTVTFNSGTVIRGFMDSVLKQTPAKFILYLVDNASSDDTLKLVAQYQDVRVVVIACQTNLGVAEGNNLGIRAALKDGCTSVLLVNNDTVFDSDLVSKLVAGLEEYQCDMIVPKILNFDHPDRIWCAGGYFSRIRAASGHFGDGQKDRGQFDQPRAVDYSPTCCMLVRREVFYGIGLMDANYFVYFDDTDFCHRAYRAGKRLFYKPSARLLHKVGSLTGGVRSEFTLRYCTRNHTYYLLKNFPGWQILLSLPAFQICIFAKYVFWERRLKAFWVAEKAFWEGISLFCNRVENADGFGEPTEAP
jgi:GT2 family glycosyltransferase